MGRLIAAVLLLILMGLGAWWFLRRVEPPASPGASMAMVAAQAPQPGSAEQKAAAPESLARRQTPAVESPMQEQEGVLELTVLGPAGPVTRASVSLFFRGDEDPATREPVWRLAGRGETGEQGLLRLPTRPGSYLVRATASGSGAATLTVRRPAGEAVTRVTLKLPPPLSLEGRVVEKESGNGLAGAELQLTLGGTLRQRAQAPAELRYTTQADVKGQFRFEQLEPGRYELIATAPSRATRRLTEIELPAVKPLVIALPNAAYLEGYVLNAQGQGEANASIVAAGGEVPQEATTGASGSFSLEVTPGVLYLSARKGSLTGRLPRPVTVAAGATVKDVRLVLSDACQLSGTVRARSDGLPVPGAVIDLAPRDAVGVSGHAVADEAGSYRAEAPCGIHDVTVRAPGHARRSQRGLVLVNGRRSERDFELEALGTISGTVRRAGGEPVEGVKVTFGSRPGFPSEAVAAALTGADGGYVLEEVPPGEGVVEVKPPGFDSGPSQRVKVPGGGVARADFTVPGEGVKLTGQVVDASGKPVSKRVEISAFTSGLAAGSMSAEDGTFELSLPAGDWKVAAFDGKRESPPTQVTLKPPGPAQVVLTLEELTEGIPVRVIEPDGTPSPKARVVFRGGPKRQIFFGLYLDDEGGGTYNPKFSPPPGERFTAVAYQGLRSGMVETGVKAASIVVPLAAAASIEGQVRSASGAPVTRFTLHIPINEWMGEEKLEFFGDRFVVEEVPAGKWTLKAVSADGSSGEKQLEAVPGQRTRVQLDLQSGASIRLRLVDATSGAALQGWVQVDDSAEFHDTVDGIAAWGNVAPGKHRLRIGSGLRQRVEREIEVKAGQQLELGDVPLREGERPGGLGARFVWAPAGVQVSWVLPEGPAQRAGIRPGDIMLGCEQVSFLSLADLEPFEQGTPGATVACQLRRGPQTIGVTVIRAG
ncbi:MAG TPA: carboxypeptidase regulatory-like domain-containing protein [Myxococcaceae bacterium]|nr:carboxypeptidase regulatory-like domain-containing protein [Myxococcaceae bacterium]